MPRTDRTPLKERFYSKFIGEPNSGCWLWTAAVLKDGYGHIAAGGRHGMYLQAHRASWEIHRGPIPPGVCVLHKCDTPSCVNPDHLFLGTQLENIADRHAKGRSRAPRKLTAGALKEIRARVVAGETRRDLAEEFGVDPSTVSRAISGNTYGGAA